MRAEENKMKETLQERIALEFGLMPDRYYSAKEKMFMIGTRISPGAGRW